MATPERRTFHVVSLRCCACFLFAAAVGCASARPAAVSPAERAPAPASAFDPTSPPEEPPEEPSDEALWMFRGGLVTALSAAAGTTAAILILQSSPPPYEHAPIQHVLTAGSFVFVVGASFAIEGWLRLAPR